jgi:hypothetical protein
MKTRLKTFALLTATILVLASCATSRGKYGCPSVAYKAQKPVNKS